MIVSSAVACETCDMENQRLKAYRAGVVTEPKTKLRRGEHQKNLAQAASGPSAREWPSKWASRRWRSTRRLQRRSTQTSGYTWLRPGGATSDSSRHGGAVGAFPGCSVVKHSRLSSFARQNNNMSKLFSVHAIRFATDRKAVDRGHFRNTRKVVAHSSIWG